MKEYLWTEKYRPRKIAETILPDRYKEMFSTMVESGSIPNLIFTGRAGIGKTSVAKAMCDELACSYMVINGSLDGTKDTLRNEIRDFASTMSMVGKRKFVILDEADGLSNNMQQGLRNFMEEFSSNCGFILTCNRPYKIAPELHSRCTLVEFEITSSEKSTILKKIAQRMFKILDQENVEYDKRTVVSLIQRHFPDIRKVINDLQRYSINGKIDSGILVNFDKIMLEQLVAFMRKKAYSSIRKFVAENDIDVYDVFTMLYDVADDYWVPSSGARIITLLADYQDMATRAPNTDITLCAALLSISAAAEWKDK